MFRISTFQVFRARGDVGLMGTLVLCLVLSGCSRSNNLLLGKVEAKVGTHVVVVTDCYRTSVPPPEKLEDATGAQSGYRFTPCRDADVLIRGEELTVNGQSYGRLKANAGVLVDHGVVSTHLVSAN